MAQLLGSWPLDPQKKFSQKASHFSIWLHYCYILMSFPYSVPGGGIKMQAAITGKI